MFYVADFQHFPCWISSYFEEGEIYELFCKYAGCKSKTTREWEYFAGKYRNLTCV